MAYATFSFSTALLDPRVVVMCLAHRPEKVAAARDVSLILQAPVNKPATSQAFESAWYAGCEVERK